MRDHVWYHANTTLHIHYVFVWNTLTACVECTRLVEVHVCKHTFCGTTRVEVHAKEYTQGSMYKKVHVRKYVHARKYTHGSTRKKYTRVKQNTCVLCFAL